MIIDDGVLELTIQQLYRLKLKLAQQYANGDINKDNWMRADIAINSIITTKKEIIANKF